MTAHELAKALLAGPDLPVIINGWGSDEGFTFEVNDVYTSDSEVFSGASDTPETPRGPSGSQLPRPAVSLGHCQHTPLANWQISRAEEAIKEYERIKRENPRMAELQYASIKRLTPDEFAKMAENGGR